MERGQNDGKRNSPLLNYFAFIDGNPELCEDYSAFKMWTEEADARQT
jgi:hypothetical protein